MTPSRAQPSLLISPLWDQNGLQAQDCCLSSPLPKSLPSPFLCSPHQHYHLFLDQTLTQQGMVTLSQKGPLCCSGACGTERCAGNTEATLFGKPGPCTWTLDLLKCQHPKNFFSAQFQGLGATLGLLFWNILVWCSVRASPACGRCLEYGVSNYSSLGWWS
jgi:hypothetical protein